MYHLFITGDSDLDPVTSYELVLKLTARVLRKATERGIPMQDVQFVTGSLPTGVERAVRYLYGGVSPLVTITYPLNAEGEPDFEMAFGPLDIDAFVILHADPLGDRMAEAAVRVFGDKVHMPLNEDLVG